MKKYLLIICCLISLSSCDNKNEDMKRLAQANIKSSLQDQESYRLIGISEPDSCFGTHYMSNSEINGIIKTMEAVTRKIMKETANLTNIDNASDNSMKLAERQMEAATTINSLLSKVSRVRGKWSGWKLKADYEAKDVAGNIYRSERWFFLNKEGNKVTKTFEIPIP